MSKSSQLDNGESARARRIRVALVLSLATALLLVGAQSAFAASISVPGDYGTIQEAVDAATSGDTINVAAGTYTEQILIGKSLDLVGAGEGATIIQAPAVRTGSINEDVLWDYIVAADGDGSPIDVSITGVTVDANDQANTGGTAGLIGVFFRDVAGAGAGVFSSTIYGFEATEYMSYAVRVWGASELAIDDNELGDYTRDGIKVWGDDGAGVDPDVAISGNTVAGSGTCLNGIVVDFGAVAQVTDNNVTGHTRSAPWAAVGILVGAADGTAVTGNTVDGNFYGIWLGFGVQNVAVSGNTLTDNVSRGVSLGVTASITVSDNTITGPAAGTDDTAVGLSNGATGNTIDGNTIVMAVGSGNGYAIYVQANVGAGSNTVSNNTITGGRRAVQLDGPPGCTGTTTVINNTISGQDFAGICGINNGDMVVSGNNLANTVRGIEFWGPADITITGNTINDSTYLAVNLGNFTGTADIGDNTISGVSNGHGIWAQVSGAGLSIHGNTIHNVVRGIQVNTSATSADIDGNEVYDAHDYAGICIDSGASGARITNNYVHDNDNGGIVANAQTTEFGDNRVVGNGFGVELGASGATFVLTGNSIAGNDPDGSADHGVGSVSGLSVYDGTAVATGNYWGAVSGPYNATTNPSGTGNAVSDNVTFIPFLTGSPVAVGTNMAVPFEGATLVFSNVTHAGTVSGGRVEVPNVVDPPGFSLSDGSFFDLSTTASFNGTVDITLPYDSAEVVGDESELKMFHREGGAWKDITISVDTVNDTVTGRTSSFSLFGVGYPGSTTYTPASSLWSLALLLVVGAVSLLVRRPYCKSGAAA